MQLPRRPLERTLLLIAVVGFVVAALLAWFGAGVYLAARDEAWTLWDRVYLVVQTFTLQLPFEPGPTPYPAALQVARFLGPLVLAYTAALALALLFVDLVDEVLWVRARGRGHTIICGVGAVGSAAIRQMRVERSSRWTGPAVVAIELERGTGGVDEARRRGVAVVFGDATEPSTWRRAGATKAARILIACGEDQFNGEAAETLADLLDGCAHEVTVAVHVEHPELAKRQRARRRAEPDRPVTIDTFSIPENGAVRILAEHPPPPTIGRDPRRVVVVGAGLFAAAALDRVVQIWSTSGPVRGGPERTLVLVDPGAPELERRLRRQAPDIDEVLRLVAVPERVEGHQQAQELLAGDHRTRVYVCLEDEAEGLEAALLLAGGIAASVPPGTEGGREGPNPVVVWTGRRDGLAKLVAGGDEASRRRVVGLSPLELSCDPITLFGPDRTRLARMAHEAYSGLQAAFPDPDRTPGSDPSFEPWATLDPGLRASNEAQVDGMRAHFDLVGIPAEKRLGPLLSPVVPQQVDDAELWRLARYEHIRWWRDKRAGGWSFGPRNNETKTHPNMCPWAALTDGDKEKDREAVQAYQRSLAALGLRLPRRTSQGPLGSPGWEDRAC